MSNYSKQQHELIELKIRDLQASNLTWGDVALGRKIKSNNRTGELAIVLFVDEKLPANDLSSNNVFPESITVNGVDDPIITDVQVSPVNFRSLACYDLPVIGPDDSAWPEPIKSHRQKQRPLKGGISLGTFGPRGYDHPRYLSMAGGTLGGLAIDRDDNTVVGVTNNHVLANAINGAENISSFTGSRELTYWSILSANETIFAEGEIRYPVYQRSNQDEYTDSKSVLDTLKVGTVKRAYPFTGDNNQIDVSIFALDTAGDYASDLFSRTESFKQHQMGASGVGGASDSTQKLDWASTSELNNLLTTDPPIFFAGRTSGPVGWPGSQPYGPTCTISVQAINSSGSVNFGYGDSYRQGDSYKGDRTHSLRDATDPAIGSGRRNNPRFVDQIRFESAVAGAGAQSGDSGSFVCALFNEGNVALSAWKVIGVLNSGESSNTFFKCGRIDHIAHYFNLGPYKGEDLDVGYKNVDIKVVNSRQSAVTAEIDDEMYWQAGATNDFGKHYSNFGE